MPTTQTPTQRLEAMKQRNACSLCRWLHTLPDEERGVWQEAIMNPRYSTEIVADVVRDEQGVTGYAGRVAGIEGIRRHRLDRHQ